ncbi:MAG TPA: hypothetical protein VNK04_06990 [Gemmataceae bacterium]|nr:hypothetical protein [Gemmataceae bacterium]
MTDALKIIDLINDTPPTSRRRETLHEGSRGTNHDLLFGSDTVMDQPAAEKRSAPRYPVSVPVLAVPVLPDGSPDWERRATGASWDLSANGIGLILNSAEELQTAGLVLVFHDDRGALRCAGVDVRYARKLSDGRLRVGGRFGGYAQQLLAAENLTPRFSSEQMAFILGFPEETLNKWAEVGILQPVLHDRVQLCPLCGGLPTFRNGCPNCGSARLGTDWLIHHFPCAHVDHAAAFDDEGELVCPKCRTRRLVVGTDFEYLQGPYRCLDCNWSDTELEHVGGCLRCGFRFPARQAREMELRGYRAHRLDPLALLPPSRSTGHAADRPVADRRPPVCPEQDRPVPVGQCHRPAAVGAGSAGGIGVQLLPVGLCHPGRA